MTYYNTTNETGATLTRNTNKAKTQDQKVYEYFRSHPEGLFTAEHIHEKLFLYGGNANTPLTSVRRAITNLMNAGKVTKTAGKKLGKYGRSIYLYKLASSPALF